MSAIFECLNQFVDALDLLLDGKKTFVWSTSSSGRQSLRDQGFAVVDGYRMLGAHIQTTRRHTNSTQVTRISSLQSLWPKLTISAAPYDLKVRAIRTAGWPKGLHAIAATTVSLQIFTQLRAGAMKGLAADGSGCNSMVHLGMIERPATDPHFWTLLSTFRMVRECGIHEVVHSSLWEIACGNNDYASNGISATLLTRIQFLGWHVLSPALLVDDFGSFSLFSVSLAELQWRMERAWVKTVAAHVSHRPGFEGLENVDPVRTRQWLAKLPVDDRAAFRKILNGAHLTQDGKHYCQETDSDVCPYCTCSDSRFHRFWVCDRFEDCRQGIPAHVRALVPDLPECVTCYGWSLRPSTYHEWYSYLHGLPSGDVPVLPWPSEGCVHVFTDGSCCNPGYADLRFAAFSVVLADATMNRPAVLLECGVLPGLRQTSVRAELYAVMRAVRFACCRGLELMIWSDCQAVVRRLRRILQGAAVRINSPNADLWMMIADDISAGAHVQITKVKAHCTVSSANSPLEEWCYLHNQFADRAAVRANESRGEEFWLLLARPATACRSVDEWNSCIQQVLIAISRRVLCHERMTDSPEPSPSVPGPPPKWTALPPMPSPPKGAVRWYGEGLVMKLLKWFWHAVQCEPGPVVWISHAQMYIDFALTTGEAGPVHINGWRDSADMPLHALLHTGFKTRARWFGKVLRETLRHANVDVVAGYSVPTSHMIHMHCSCLGVPWDPGRLDAVDRWLMKFSKTPFRRQTKELDRLPVPH